MHLSEEELADLLKDNPQLTIESDTRAREVGPGPAPVKAATIPAQHEADFQKWLIRELQDAGWRVCEFRKARIKKGGHDVYRTPFGANGSGMVDIIAVKGEICLFIENKSENGKATAEQMKWLLALNRVKITKTLVLKPSDAEQQLGEIGIKCQH